MAPNLKDHPVLSLFTELLVPSPSGREGKLAAIVREKLDELGYSHQTDGAGNLTVRLEGREEDGPLCVLASHMDEIGMAVTRIEADGVLRVDRSGGLYPWKLGEGPVEILGDEDTITGVLSFGSTHTAKTLDKAIQWKDVRLLTGLTPAQLQEAGVRPGSTAVPDRPRRGPVLFGDPEDPLVGAWTFDDRMGVVMLLLFLERLKKENLQPLHPTIIAFTVQEEVGGHGAKIVAQRERPEIFIAVDGCPIPPGAPLLLDGRPGIWSKDSRAHYDQALLRELSQAAQAAGTELQPVVFDGAASDASLTFTTGAVPRVACMGHVRENSHGYEVARLSVFENVVKTLVQWAVGSSQLAVDSG